ncbi:MAG: PEP/pyruvate-binding domain-containing protein [Candidatus Micrarchaeota archaeon]
MNQKQRPSVFASQISGSPADAYLARKAPLGDNIGNIPFRSIKHSGGERNNRFGGKFAGLTFICDLLNQRVIQNRTIGGIEIKFMIPPTWELPNGFHVDFINHNKDIVTTGSHSSIRESFAKAKLPKSVTEALRLIVRAAKSNVLVFRSDSFCEDGIHPFAGEFTTEFVVLKGTEEQKIEQLGAAFKLVSASLYEPRVQKLIEQLGLSSSEQWMSFVVEEVHGKEHIVTVDDQERRLFFPDFSMVAFSKCLAPWNNKLEREDPIIRIGAGLGTYVVKKDRPCRVMPLRFPQTPGPWESYVVSEVRKGATGDNELDEYADRTQGSFDAIDLVSGKVVEINFGSIQKSQLLELFSNMVSGYSQSRGMIEHLVSDIGDHTILRTTFMGDAKLNSEFYTKALLDLVALLKEEAGFDVDIELAVKIDGRTREVALLQNRPFGMSADNSPVVLTEISSNKIIAKADNCMGHGKQEFSLVAMVLEKHDGGRKLLAALNDLNPNEYVLIGPDASTSLSSGGVYQGCTAPGAVVDIQGTGNNVSDAGCHDFMNIAMKLVLPVNENKLNVGPLKGEIKNGILVSRQKVKVEVNGETGKGQLFLLD